jgi:hypothetical protein
MTLWVKSVVSGAQTDVRYYPQSDRLLPRRETALYAISDQSAVQQKQRSSRSVHRLGLLVVKTSAAARM